jgi:VWFA-related protein
VARFKFLVVAASLLAVPLLAQNATAQTQAPASSPDASSQTLRTTSRAVLVDVIVSDRKGKPVTGLKQGDFTVTEQGKPQTVSFFEEHTGAVPNDEAELPKLPPDVFSNFSPFPTPDAVNVLLLDSVNTRMESQSFVHSQAMKFLKSAKPGSRMAIFTMGLGLHFIQGFTEDPALLMAALNNKKNNEVESSMMIKGQDETNGQAEVVGMMQAPAPGGGTVASPEAISALKQFFAEQDTSLNFDRGFVTLANLQRLATFLTAFPGRKNVIWFTESIPPFLSIGSGPDALATMASDPGLEAEYKKTMNMLAAARMALYPVDARGVATTGFYQADNKLPSTISAPYQITGVDSNPTQIGKDPTVSPTSNAPGAQVSNVNDETTKRNSDQMMQEIFAQDSGGKAFANTNGLSQVIDNISTTGSDFYTISYTPINAKMDGGFRKIEVKVGDGKYALSYRRGYYAIEADLPGAALTERSRQIQKLAAQNPGAVDPLLAFMDLGMPQSTQIIYKTRVQPLPAGAANSSASNDAAQGQHTTYGVDFLVDLNDLDLKLNSDGNHEGKLNISLIVYDRYGKIVSRKDHIVGLSIKPDVYTVFESTGVQLHAEISAPKGNLWLRTGVYDQASQKVGTLEVPLSAVKPVESADQ